MILLAALAAALALGAIESARADLSSATTASAGAAALDVGGKVPHFLHLSMADIAAMDHVTVSVTSGKSTVSFSGVPLIALLKAAGLSFDQMKDARASADLCVIVGAADGYKVVFSLAELDPQFEDAQVILADQQNGRPIDAAHGPLRIVAPHEAAHARWVHQVTSLTVVQP
jgi:DMSO/TMAO reductase YedYZ molybdopterin-dependent catalytic subunit